MSVILTRLSRGILNRHKERTFDSDPCVIVYCDICLEESQIIERASKDVTPSELRAPNIHIILDRDDIDYAVEPDGWKQLNFRYDHMCPNCVATEIPND